MKKNTTFALLPLLALTCAILFAAAQLSLANPTSTSSASSAHFRAWKEQHGKRYASAEEEAHRAQVWLANMKMIEEFNALGRYSYTLGMNAFGDLTPDEFRQSYIRTQPPLRSPSAPTYRAADHAHAQKPLPTAVDWREKNAVSPVTNQGQCGSSPYFSAVGALEGLHAITTGKLYTLSVQQVIDCSRKYGNEGCNGGEMTYTFTYVKAVGGLETNVSYPYTGLDAGTCHFNKSRTVATCTGHVNIKSDSEADMQSAVANHGPVATAMDANDIQFYKSGVYDPPAGTCQAALVGHGIMVAGYGVDQQKDYWLLKNTWGVEWGEKGYLRSVRNKNDTCGVALYACYPV